jgi:ABC-type bacteriocin/lantibiotic exporter with double-glycine peptidase domain
MTADEALISNPDDQIDFTYSGFKPEIALDNVAFKYSENSNFALRNISLHVKPGQQVAIVGSS